MPKADLRFLSENGGLTSRGLSDQKLAALVEWYAVYGDLAAVAHVADHVPVDGRFVLATCIGVAGPHSRVNRPAEFFVKENIAREFLDPVVRPDGEIFTGPQEDVTTGHIEFTYPAIFQGREVEGIALTFEKGRVIKASAKKGEDLLSGVIRPLMNAWKL